jgi:hypothetical protein
MHHTDKVRCTCSRIVCAGGYFAAGFHGTIGHSDAWNRIDTPNRYTFTVRDEGVRRQWGVLYEFFKALPFWRLQPFEGVTGKGVVALAEPGKVYLVYLPRGGDLTVDLSAAQAPLTAPWFNSRDGLAGEPFLVTPGESGRFQAPDAQDWVLQLRETPR